MKDTVSIKIRGEAAELKAVITEIREQFSDEQVEIGILTPYVGTLISRDSYRQIELFDVLVGILVNLGSNAIYNQLKTLLEKRAAGKKIEIVEEDMSHKKQKLPNE